VEHWGLYLSSWNQRSQTKSLIEGRGCSKTVLLFATSSTTRGAASNGVGFVCVSWFPQVTRPPAPPFRVIGFNDRAGHNQDPLTNVGRRKPRNVSRWLLLPCLSGQAKGRGRARAALSDTLEQAHSSCSFMGDERSVADAVG
jgi:hypothetical protein